MRALSQSNDPDRLGVSLQVRKSQDNETEEFTFVKKDLSPALMTMQALTPPKR